MSPPVAPLLAALLLAAEVAAPAVTAAEGALLKCWAQEVTAACAARDRRGDDAALEACEAERAKTACAPQRAAFEKALAAALASDALELLAAGIKTVCSAEAAGPPDGGRSAPEQEALAEAWRQALEVRSEFMRACERSGREARDCDDAANDAERRARAASCPTGR
jgi:hypothetical protein